MYTLNIATVRKQRLK